MKTEGGGEPGNRREAGEGGGKPDSWRKAGEPEGRSQEGGEKPEKGGENRGRRREAGKEERSGEGGGKRGKGGGKPGRWREAGGKPGRVEESREPEGRSRGAPGKPGNPRGSGEKRRSSGGRSLRALGEAEEARLLPRPGTREEDAPGLVEQILRDTRHPNMTRAPMGTLYMRPLRWIFLLLLLFSLLTMCYITLSSRAGLEHLNLLYFYEYEPVYRQPRPFALRERRRCADTQPFLVILVASSPGELRARQAIRISWGSQDSWWGQRVLTLFLLGRAGRGADGPAALSVEDESVLYGDIVRQDFLDTYDNLTLKTIMAFQWFSEFCPNARFFMKTDVDVFINTPNLVKLLLRLNSSENVFTGFPLIQNFAYRGFDRKRFISYEEYPFRLYPPYCSGLGYILDGKLALRTYELMGHVKPLKFEDVYVGICLNLLKVNVTLPEDAEQFFLYKIDFDICKYRHLIAVHGLTSSELVQFWQDLSSDTSKTCL